MQTEFVIFVFLALATLIGAAGVALSRNIFWSAMGLLSSLVGVGGLYVLLSADFVAITQLLVYIGGVLVLIIFAVMLTSQIQDINVSNRSMGLVGGYAILFVAATCCASSPSGRPGSSPPRRPWSKPRRPSATDCSVPGCCPSKSRRCVLLATLIGAIVIARKEDQSRIDRGRKSWHIFPSIIFWSLAPCFSVLAC